MHMSAFSMFTALSLADKIADVDVYSGGRICDTGACYLQYLTCVLGVRRSVQVHMYSLGSQVFVWDALSCCLERCAQSGESYRQIQTNELFALWFIVVTNNAPLFVVYAFIVHTFGHY